MQLVGITGGRGNGKGEVAASIARWATDHGLTSEERGFADAGKVACARIFWPNISREDALAWANHFKNDPFASVRVDWRERGDIAKRQTITSKRQTITGRQLFQNALTEGGRNIHGPDIWVDALLEMMHGDLSPRAMRNFGRADNTLPTYGLVADLRFDNEAERIKKLGGQIWCVERPGRDLGDGHASEAGIDSSFIDLNIVNNGTLEQLDESVRLACDNHLAGGSSS